jgi:hypothetical protein
MAEPFAYRSLLSRTVIVYYTYFMSLCCISITIMLERDLKSIELVLLVADLVSSTDSTILMQSWIA